MNVLKKIKNILRLLIFICLISSLTGCFTDIEVKENQTIEESMQDVSKRAFYSTYGEIGLQAYSVDSNIDYSKLKEVDKNYYMTPFADNYGKIIYLILLTVNSLSLLGAGSYLVVKLFQALINTTKSGIFMGEKTNVQFFFIKHFIVYFLLFMSAPPYNTAQIYLFKAIGYSNVIANKINDSLISNQPQSFPTLKIPAADSKSLQGAKLIQFMACIKSDPNVRSKEIILNFFKDGGLVKAQSSYGNCNINFTLGIDQETTEILRKNEEIRKLIDLKVDFEEVQFTIQKKIIENLIKNADNAADIMISKNDLIRNEPELFNKYLSKAQSNDSFVNNWENHCDDILNYKITKTLIKEEKEQYKYLASRCISYNIIKSLVYPDIENFSNYLKTNNYLRDNEIQMCNQDYTNTSLSKVTVIEETVVGSKQDTSLIKKRSLKDCVASACSNLNSNNSNAFICANAVSLFDKVNRNETMSRNGFMLTGAYIQTLFSNSKISDTSKSLVNNFDIKFSKQGINIDTPLKENIVFTIKHPFKITQDKVMSYVLFNANSMALREHKKIFSNVENSNPNLVNTSLTGFDLLGSDRFLTCTLNPLRFYNGYNCASIPEETHVFGKNLFTYTVYLKTTIAAFNTVKKSVNVAKKVNKKRKKRKDKKNPEKVETADLRQETFMSTLKTNVSKYLPAALGNTSALILIDNFFGGGQTNTDQFGDFNSEKYGSIIDDPMILKSSIGAFLLSASGDNILSTMIGFVINIFMLIGLFFAYVIPLMPTYLWLLVMISWFTSIFATLVILSIWIPSILGTSQNHTSEIMERGMRILKTVIFKPPLYIAGLILAWVLTNYVGYFISILKISDALHTQSGNDLSSIITSLIILIVYCVTYYFLITKIFTLIQEFEESSQSWLVGNITGLSMANDKIQGMYGKVNQLKNIGK